MRKRISILGSTGSIGRSALAVVDAHSDRLQIVGLAAGENDELLAAQIARYQPRIAAMATGSAIDRLRRTLPPGVTNPAHAHAGPVPIPAAKSAALAATSAFQPRAIGPSRYSNCLIGAPTGTGSIAGIRD